MTAFCPNPTAAAFGTELPGLTVERVDPRSEEARQRELWRVHWDLVNACDRRSQGDLAAIFDPETQRTNRTGSRHAYWAYIALVSGEPVGCAWVFCNRDDAIPSAVFVSVEPEFRGQGIARGVLPILEADARTFGRSDIEAVTDLEPGVADEDSPGLRFARAAGYREYQRHRVQALDLPLPAGFGDGPAPAGYRVETCEGVPPQAWHEGLARLNECMATDTPHGDRPPIESTWDAARVEREYARYVELGEPVVTAVAVEAGTGRLVGYSSSSWIPSAPAVIRQEDTLVLGEHRGHGLGRAMKVAAITRIVPLCPGARLQRTSNAAENTPMLRVNAELGYRHAFDTAILTKPAGAPGTATVPGQESR